MKANHIEPLAELDLTQLGGRLLTRAEVSLILGVPVKTLSNWAHLGRGSRVIHLGFEMPRYALADINAWITEVNQAGEDA